MKTAKQHKQRAALSVAVMILIGLLFSAGSMQAQPSVKIDKGRVTIKEGVTNDIMTEIKKAVGDQKDLDFTLEKIKSNDDIAKVCTAYPEMKSLDIRAEKEVNSIAPVAKLKSITKFRMSGGSVTDLKPLSGLTGLTSLYIQSDGLVDLKWMSSLTNLSTLELHGSKSKGSNFVSLEGIPAMPKLKSLHIQEAAPKSLDPLKVLAPTLTSLTLFWCEISDLTPLKGLSKLEKLSLYGSVVKDFSPLAGCPALKELNFYATKDSDYSTLGKITQLEVLDGGLTDLNDISWITTLTKLKKYRMFAESVKDYSPLAKLTQLEELKMWQMKVKPVDLSFLKGTTNLKKLILTDMDGVTNVNAIQSLTYLTSLEMTKFNTKTNGGEAIPLAIIKKLPNLNEFVVTKAVFTDAQLTGFANTNIRIRQN